MTPEQITTFAAAIAANTDQTIVDALAAGNNNAIVAWYNQTASPAVWVFKDSVDTDSAFKAIDKSEYIDVPASGGTTVTQLIQALEAASLARRQEVALNLMFANGTYDPSLEANRDALVAIFPSSMPNTRAAMLADGTRQATYAEALFITTASGPAGGDGSSQNNSAIAGFIGSVSLQDVRDAVAIING